LTAGCSVGIFRQWSGSVDGQFLSNKRYRQVEPHEIQQLAEGVAEKTASKVNEKFELFKSEVFVPHTINVKEIGERVIVHGETIAKNSADIETNKNGISRNASNIMKILLLVLSSLTAFILGGLGYYLWG